LRSEFIDDTADRPDTQPTAPQHLSMHFLSLSYG
jgi:hypothetical protein